MKRKIIIYDWHGGMEKVIMDKFHDAVKDGGEYTIAAITLDEFFDIWKDKFMVLTHKDDEFTLTIAVTKYSNFSQM